MTTTKGSAIAAPQIFGSDPMEQLFAKGVIGGDPGMSGMAGALMLAAGMNRERNQGTYLDELHKSNAMASALAQQEMKAQMLETALKEGHHYTGQGFMPADIPALAASFRDPNAASVTAPPAAALDYKVAQAQKLRAEMAKALAEGRNADAVKIKGVLDTSQYGTGEATYTAQGTNQAAVQKALNDAAIADSIARTGKPPPNPNAPRGRTGQADDAAARAQAARRKQSNIAD